MQRDGPEYPKLGATVQKFRRLASGGLASLTREQRRAYGEAVEREILALQRRECRPAAPAEPKPNCASGTPHPDGASIHAAVRRQQAAALAAYPDKERNSRNPELVGYLYKRAMIARHGCEWFEVNQERLLKDWDSRAYNGL